MPVPTSISDLTPVAATNSPAGTESVKGTIDDYLRAHGAFIRQIYDQSLGATVTLASAATVAVGFAGSANILITGTTTITAFDAIAEGTLRWVIFSGSLTLTHNGASFYLPGGASIATAAGDVALFKSLGSGNWKCMLYERVNLRYPASGTLLSDASVIPVAQGGTGSSTAPAAINALGGLPLSGGVMSGNLDFLNGVGIYMRDGSNNSHQFVKMQGSGVNFTIAGGTAFNYYNQNGDTVVASLTNSGAWTATSVSATTVTQTSDERKKKLWQHLPKDFVHQLARIKKSGLFTWKKGGAHGVGVGAQSLERILPIAVHTDEKGHKTVNYGAAAMVSTVELARAVVALEDRLAKLEAQ